MTFITNNNSSQAWVDTAARSFRDMEEAGQAIRNEMGSNKPNMENIIHHQEKLQKSSRNLEMATNMLQTIHNMLKKIIEKLQIQ